MQTSHKIAAGLVVLALMFVGYRLVVKESHEEARENTAAQQAQTPDNPFPGQGNKQDWSDAYAIAKRAGQELEAQDYDGALSLNQQAMQKYPYDSHFYKQLGIILVRRNHAGDMQNAETAFKKAIELKNDDPIFYSLLATILAEENKLQEAHDMLTKALQLNPPADQAEQINQNLQKVDAALGNKGS